MPTDVIMPQMGESIFEGTITKWLKQPGDPVEKDEPLFEISTDKVDAEIPSPAAGVLTEIREHEGATVQINTIVAVIGDANAHASSGKMAATPSPASDLQHETQPQSTVPAPAAQVHAGPVVQGSTNIVMPQMGESVFEGTITKWLKKPGDRVEKDEPLFEISTDKVDAEIPSPVAGILTEIHAPEGATVQVNAVVAVIGGSLGGSAKSTAVSAPTSQPATAMPIGSATAAAVPAQAVSGRQSSSPLRLSPLVRRIAKDHNVDLAQVRGTGSEGRITKEDILRYLSQPETSTKISAPLQGAPQVVAGQVVPMSRMRAIIGQRMLESVRISPHAHTVYKIDMTRITRLRERERAAFEQRHGVKLTYMPFIAAAAVRALQKFPIVNASLIDGNIHYHANIHIGIAVALEGGLIVPVIRDAEQRSFIDLARAINDLALRARGKKLNPDEAAGSTFTLTNSGVFGGEYGTPILNQPESAILAIGGLRKEPVVLTDADGNDTIAIRSMQYYCLGFDHRTIDGADAGKFMSEFKSALENWSQPLG
ncbi:MAG TPA: 2-oxoglutarate dehydrogenase, E2 component, dihydrolipoamide succinyltransferase [Terracidiphilus sp.]|nr:2-oxoglutarate dehydrogenase, E2 component, dihydrolipoamide succinyltransferase [Terracidiphilus sp.]